MSIVEFFTLLGGLAMFLFGMRVMGDALEKCAGNQLKSILEKLTSSTFKGFMLGLGVTLIIQSSSATTVMVVGFVNSGLMTLHQATGVIMGANLGTSVTAWLLSTSGIQGDGILQLFKPESFAPLFAFVGIILYMFQKNRKRQDVGHAIADDTGERERLQNADGCRRRLNHCREDGADEHADYGVCKLDENVLEGGVARQRLDGPPPPRSWWSASSTRG